MERPKHGGHLVAQVLKGEGVANLFTLSGGHIAPIYDGCVLEEIRVSQRAGDRRFETVVQLLEDAKGGDLIRFAYSTGGTARRGPVTLRGRDLERLRAELESRPRLADALGLAPRQSPSTRE